MVCSRSKTREGAHFVAKNVAQFMLERLSEWGVKRIYGYPGDGINGFLGAFHEADDSIEFIQTSHEELAAFAACAHAKLTDEVGVCMATSGPGAIHLLNGLYDAKLDHRPVVAIVGQQVRMALGSHYQQEVDLLSLYKDVASEFVQYCMAPEQAAHLIDRAIRIAKASRSVTCIIVPDDVAESEHQDPPRQHGAVFSSEGFPKPPRVSPQEDDLRRAAEVLNAGEKVAMLIGAGARHAAAEVKEIANILGCGVAKALNGRDALPDDLPFVTGAAGLLGTKPTTEMMENCDTLFMVGSSFPYSEWLPEPGQARGVQIDIDGAMIGIRYPMEVNLVGDSKERWSDPRLIVLVLNNQDLNQVTWEQRVLAGDPKLEASQNLPDFPFARYAEMLGFKGIRVDNPDDVAPAWEEALAADRPAVYEAVTDPEVPPLPPHIRFEQAQSLAQAMAKGEPHGLRIVMQSLKGKLQEFTTR